MKKILSHKDFCNGSKYPKGYGLAYRPFDSLTYVLYPIPINLLVKVSREIYFWLWRKMVIEWTYGDFEQLPHAYRAKCFKDAQDASQRDKEHLEENRDYWQDKAMRRSERIKQLEEGLREFRGVITDVQTLREKVEEVKSELA